MPGEVGCASPEEKNPEVETITTSAFITAW
jgi:hypothetical protein